MADRDELLARWFADGLDAAGVAELDAALRADPALRRRFAAWARSDLALHRHRGWRAAATRPVWRRWALAAGVLLAVGLAVAAWPRRAPAAPADRIVQAPAPVGRPAPAVPPAVASVPEAPASMPDRIVTATVAVVRATAHGDLVVAPASAVRIATAPAATWFTVEAGQARFAADDGQPLTSGMRGVALAGATYRLPALAREAVLFEAEPAELPGFYAAAGDGATVAWRVEPDAPSGAHAVAADADCASGWALLGVASSAAWPLAGSGGLALWARGRAGDVVWIEVLGAADPAVPQSWDRFETSVALAREGWNPLTLPWSAFVRRTWQPPGAPGLALDPGRVHGCNLGIARSGRWTLAIDRLSAWWPSGAR